MDAGTLINVFSQTFSVDPAPRKQAEEYLKQAALQPGYTTSVLTLVAQADVPEQVRLAAAVNFKNQVKFHWVASEEDGSVSGPDFVIPDAEKAAVKQNIVGFMLAAPPLVQAQVSETLALISASDFPTSWTTLLPELVARLNSAGQDYGVINSVLSTANIIFKR
jgi:exportin-2 (importin alpha re-exporter)